MSIYSTLWMSIQDKLCTAHNLEWSYFESNDSRASAVRKKAHLLFLIEVVTFEYRKNEIDIWFKQSFNGTLSSFIYNKTGLIPSQYNQLSDSEKVAILQKHLIDYPLPEEAQNYLQSLSTPSSSDNFDIDLDAGWILGSGWRYLKQH